MKFKTTLTLNFLCLVLHGYHLFTFYFVVINSALYVEVNSNFEKFLLLDSYCLSADSGVFPGINAIKLKKQSEFISYNIFLCIYFSVKTVT